MTDETREQIKRDASKYLMHPEAEYFKQGATHQHPISYSQGLAEGRRQAIEEVMSKLNETVKGRGATMHAESMAVIIYKELEKLKGK